MAVVGSKKRYGNSVHGGYAHRSAFSPLAAGVAADSIPRSSASDVGWSHGSITGTAWAICCL